VCSERITLTHPQQYGRPNGGQQQYSAPQYAAPQYAPPPTQQYPPAPEPPKKKRKWPWVVGGFVALIVLGSAVNGGNSRSATNASPPTAPTAPVTAAQAQQPASAPEQSSPSGPDFSEGIPEGTWSVPDQVAPGKYRSTGAKEGLFEMCMVSTSSENGNVLDLDSGNAGEQVQITVTSKAAEFKNSGCEPFVKVG
jgi:hypothetical protein